MLNKIKYNGLVFDSGNQYIISQSNDDVAGNIDVNTFRLPNRDGERIISANNRRKIIRVQGTLRGNSKFNLNNKIDDLKRKLSIGEETLDVYIQTGSNTEVIRTGNAICNNPSDFITRRGSDITRADIDIQFMIPSGFLEDNSSTQTGTTSTTSNVSFTQTYNGTIKAPTAMVIDITSVGTIEEIQFEIGTLKIQVRNFLLDNNLADGDIIEFDGIEQNVFQNGNSIDFEGFFPEIDSNNNTVNIRFLESDGSNASSFDVDYDFGFINRWK